MPKPIVPKPSGYIIGLGGRDVNPENFKDILSQAKAERAQGPSQEFYLYGVRG